MKIYIAALYSMMAEANELADKLRVKGHYITARWLENSEKNKSQQDAALMDLTDIDDSDCLILITSEFGTKYSGGGRHVEFGYAYALRKKIAVLGDYEHIFCYLPTVPVFSNVDTLMWWLSR